MKPFTLLSILAFVVIFRQNACAQTENTSLADTAEKRQLVEKNLVGATHTEGDEPFTLRDRMAHFKVKGLSIAVIRNYQIHWAKGYGWADESLRIPVTDKTVFQAASISKSLNAVGVLKLVQDKKLDLYVDINTYLGPGKGPQDGYSIMYAKQLNWKFPYDSLSQGKKITMANLLSHTAGLTVHGFAGYEKGSDIPNIIQILDGKPPANSAAIRSMYEPGLKSEYSGGGITISQLIVMNVARQPYEKYMQENVLQPLGMTSSSFEQFPPREKRAFFSSAYYADGKQVPVKYHVYPEEAAAGLWTNPTDLSKYIIETQLAYEGRSRKVLDEQMTKTRLTPYIDKNAALGVFIQDMDGVKYFGHGGANEGFRSQYYGSLEDGNGVVVMVNSDNGDIIPEIVNSVAKVYNFKGLYRSKTVKALVFTDDLLQTYTGKYELRPDLILSIIKKGNQLYSQISGQRQYTMFPLAENKFSLNLEDVQIEFIKDDKGQVVKAVVYQNGPHEAVKMK